MEAGRLPGAYLGATSDPVREQLEAAQLARTARRLVARAPGGRMLDLGCGAGLGPRLSDSGMTDYTGVDFRPLEVMPPGRHVLHDLREGLGRLARRPSTCTWRPSGSPRT